MVGVGWVPLEVEHAHRAHPALREAVAAILDEPAVAAHAGGARDEREVGAGFGGFHTHIMPRPLGIVKGARQYVPSSARSEAA